MVMAALPIGVPPMNADIAEGKYYLLLDGIKLEPLERWLYERLDDPVYELIYLDTPLAECRRISPCLVSLDKGISIWEAFIENGVKDGWGWLMASAAPQEDVVAHLRWLLFVEHPLTGEQILRVASPEVMKCLLEAEPQPAASALLGELDALWLPTHEDGEVAWWYLANARQGPVPRDARFVLQQAHLDSLSRIAWQRFTEELAQHLETFFVNGPLLRQYDTAITAAKQVIATTQELNYSGRRAHYYMANILGAHGHDALDEQTMPAVAKLLTQPDGRPPMERLKIAAAEAQRLANRSKHA